MYVYKIIVVSQNIVTYLYLCANWAHCSNVKDESCLLKPSCSMENLLQSYTSDKHCGLAARQRKN